MIERIGWVLIHFLWQGAAVSALLATTLAALRKSSAAVRYAVSCGAMAVLLLAPVATFLLTSNSSDTPAQSTSGAAFTYVPVWMGTTGAAAVRSVQLTDWFPFIIAVWAFGVSVLTLRLAGGLLVAHRMRNRLVQRVAADWQQRLATLSARLGVTQVVDLCESAVVEVPTVIGWLKPVILVPASALAQLAPSQLEALLAHELAHIRRHDYLVNIIQTVVETVLFYHPAVWWTGRRIREERENCCDDIAVAVCGDPASYARALSRLEEVRVYRPQLAMAADGGSLIGRVRRLLTGESDTSRPASAWLAGIAVAFAVVIAWGGTSVFASRGDDHKASLDVRVPEAVIAQLSVNRPKPSPVPSVEARADAAPDVSADAAPAHETAAPDEDKDTDNQDAAPQATAAPESGSFVNSLAKAGYKDLSVDQLIAFKIHGVTPEYIQKMKAAGFNPTVDQLVAMRIHGVPPEFGQEMKAAGFPNLSIDELVACRIHGVNPKSIEDIKKLGFPNLTMDQVMAARIHHITPELIQGLKSAGYDHLSFDNVVAARIHGVKPELAQSFKSAGFGNLSFDDLVAARIFGVTPEFIDKVKKQGFTNLTFDKVIKLKQFGIVE